MEETTEKRSGRRDGRGDEWRNIDDEMESFCNCVSIGTLIATARRTLNPAVDRSRLFIIHHNPGQTTAHAFLHIRSVHPFYIRVTLTSHWGLDTRSMLSSPESIFVNTCIESHKPGPGDRAWHKARHPTLSFRQILHVYRRAETSIG